MKNQCPVQWNGDSEAVPDLAPSLPRTKEGANDD